VGRLWGLPRPLLAAAGALVLHGAAVGGVLLLARLPPPAWLRGEPARPPGPRLEVAVRPLSEAEWERNRRASRPSDVRAPVEPPEEPEAPAEPPPPPERRPLAEKQPGPTVDLGTMNGEAPADAAHSAERDNRVERETVARDPDRLAPNPAARRTSPRQRPAEGPHPVPAPMVAGEGGQDGRAQARRPSSRRAGPRATVELPRLAPQPQVALRPPERPELGSAGPVVPNRPGRAALEGSGEALQVQPGTEAGDPDAPASPGRAGAPGSGVANLLPSEAAMDSLVGGAQDLRHLDLEEGDGNFLNAVGWKYASFFNRFRRDVAAYWRAPEELRRRDPTGSLYGLEHRALLHVVLDGSGRLAEVVVLQSSGLDFYDRAALDAIRQAGPFPNVPQGLQDASGRVQFSFGFIVQGGRGSRLRFLQR
jgi:TonB family protein